jgi:transposase
MFAEVVKLIFVSRTPRRRTQIELRHDKRRLELEVDILKRAAAYFARENVLSN